MMTSQVFIWWVLLCGVAAFNVLAWTASAAVLSRRRKAFAQEEYATRRLQLLLSAGYVLGCGFRSILPVYDIPRLCLFDTFLSSVIVGRSVATFAELCFAAQWALLLREIARAHGGVGTRRAALAVVPLIAVAEGFSWYSVLTTSNIGHVVEESIWGLTACLLVGSMFVLWRRCNAALRPMLALWCGAGIFYIGYMFMADVPMYFTRWLADEANGRAYLSVVQGLADAAQRRVVSHHWQDWANEVTWMSLYFSVAVWLSIALVHAPVMARSSNAPETRSRLSLPGRPLHAAQ